MHYAYGLLLLRYNNKHSLCRCAFFMTSLQILRLKTIHVIMWQWCCYFLVHYWTLWFMSAATDATGNILWVFLTGVGRELNPRLYMTIPWKQIIRWLRYNVETVPLPAKASRVVWRRHLLSLYSHECLRGNEIFYMGTSVIR